MRNMPRPEIERPRLKWAASASVENRDGLLRRAFDVNVSVAVGLKIARVDLQFFGRDLQHHLFRFRAAMMTALPTRCVPRRAKVPMQCGPVSVSAVSIVTSSAERRSSPRRSAPDLLEPLAEID